MKTCRKCEVEKQDADFYKNEHNADGLHSYCKPCQTETDRVNRWNRDGQTGYKHILLEQPTDGTRICTKCREQKPLAEFSPNGLNPKGEQKYRSLCKACSANRLKEFHGKNPGKRRKYYLSSKFSISQETFDVLFAAQGKKCAACGCFEPTGHGWSIDHDHKCCPGEKSCGKCIRGIMCMNCNNALGCVDDNVDLLKKLIAYLEKFQKPSPLTAQEEPCLA